jgi:uncharacterized protein YciI
MKTIASLVLLATLIALPATAEENPPANAAMPQYLYVLHLVPRLREEKAWTPADQAVGERHFAYIKQAAAAGRLILAGRTQEPLDKTFGIAVFEAENDAAARGFMQADPAVAEGIMTAELHPYRIAAQRRP